MDGQELLGVRAGHSRQVERELRTSPVALHAAGRGSPDFEFRGAPAAGGNEQGREYDAVGEAAFLARNEEQFRAAVREDPAEFLARVVDRFVAAVVWYTPRNRSGYAEFKYGTWLARVLHPLP